jgi:hypothetical protein
MVDLMELLGVVTSARPAETERMCETGASALGVARGRHAVGPPLVATEDMETTLAGAWAAVVVVAAEAEAEAVMADAAEHGSTSGACKVPCVDDASSGGLIIGLEPGGRATFVGDGERKLWMENPPAETGELSAAA